MQTRSIASFSPKYNVNIIDDTKCIHSLHSMADLKVNFGTRLQVLRNMKGITQEQLAAEVGITVESVSNIERGIHGPRFENLEKIARALDTPVKELFDFE